ncbi:MAG: hypothetical protein JZU67_00965, partial [Burkholderiaceae bacterium]|nr:hypothetical protein [Burkholderiaceae bacterium]
GDPRYFYPARGSHSSPRNQNGTSKGFLLIYKIALQWLGLRGEQHSQRSFGHLQIIANEEELEVGRH